MKNIRNWESVSQFIKSRTHLVVTTHIHPDGDAIGSLVAMNQFLIQRGKKTVCLIQTPTPRFFQFLDPEGAIQTFSPERDESLLAAADGVVVVDVSDWKRLGRIGQAIQKAKIPVACIDHHIPTDVMGEVQVIDQSPSSTGELLYDYFVAENAFFSQLLVNALYTCILTDTGSFRYSNTTPQTHRITADLIQKGANFIEIYHQVYENYSSNRAKLMGHLLADMHFEADGRLAWYSLSRELLQSTGAQLEETEGFSELPRSIAGVEVSIMFLETQSGTKLSFRSKGKISIIDLAASFGGGGHAFAAGAGTDMSLDEAIRIVIPRTIEHLNSKST